MITFIGLLGIIVIIAGSLIYNCFVWSFVAFKAYKWFILPIFQEAPNFSYMQIVGIMLFLSVLTYKIDFNKKEDKKTPEENARIIVSFIIVPWLVLLIQYLFWLLFF